MAGCGENFRNKSRTLLNLSERSMRLRSCLQEALIHAFDLIIGNNPSSTLHLFDKKFLFRSRLAI